MPATSPHSRRLVSETLDFLRQSFGMRGAIFYWILPGLETINESVVDLPAGLTDAYRQDMWSLDPLLASRLVRAEKCVAELGEEARAIPPGDWLRYSDFLKGFGVTGNLDFLFWTDEGPMRRAFGGISLIGLAGDPTLPCDTGQLVAAHRYLSFTLRSHERVTRERLHTTLRMGAGLTRRETEICALVAAGAANQDIAGQLGLTLATTKFYMKRIFDKMGVASRTALAARLAYLQLN